MRTPTIIAALLGLVLVTGCKSAPETQQRREQLVESSASGESEPVRKEERDVGQTASVDHAPTESRPRSDGAKSIAEEERTCEDGDFEACARLVHQYGTADGVSRDIDASVRYLRRICESGHFETCQRTAMELIRDDLRHGTEVAIQTFSPLCASGDVRACQTVVLSASVTDIPVMRREAYNAMKRTCERGHDGGCRAMIQIPKQVASNAHDIDLSRHLADLDKACERDYEPACEQLGEYFYRGLKWNETGVAPDADRARGYYEKAGKTFPGDLPPRITVYSKPSGEIFVDGEPTGEHTPQTVEVEAGEHEVTVHFETGTTSETKKVSAQKGRPLELFYRER